MTFMIIATSCHATFLPALPTWRFILSSLLSSRLLCSSLSPILFSSNLFYAIQSYAVQSSPTPILPYSILFYSILQIFSGTGFSAFVAGPGSRVGPE